jgi:hypothetical protein
MGVVLKNDPVNIFPGYRNAAAIRLSIEGALGKEIIRLKI